MNKQFSSDIDIDFGNRDDALKHLKHTAATLMRDGKPGKHASGVYFTDIPVDPFTGSASLQYERAEELGYVKLDFLNVSLYQQIKSEQHLVELMNTEPPWHRLNEREFCEQLMHLGNHYDTIHKMPEPVNSIPRLAMMLSVIRPAKRHLIGKNWADVAKTVWEPDPNGGYAFKKSHSIAYATLVVVHMNLLNNSSN
jgi:DNA polymerase III alpha subunit